MGHSLQSHQLRIQTFGIPNLMDRFHGPIVFHLTGQSPVCHDSIGSARIRTVYEVTLGGSRPEVKGASKERFKMQRRSCLAWCVYLGLAIDVVAADTGPPESERVAVHSNGQQLVETDLPPAPVASDAVAYDAGDASGLPTTIVSQSTIYAAPTPAAPTPSAPKPPPQPWKLTYFDNDFSYKYDPNHLPLLGENFKDVPLGGLMDWEGAEETRISAGGEIRWRSMNEVNRLRPPFLLQDRSVYDLIRWRNYLDLKHSDWVRIYVEMIDAEIFNNDLPATGIDRNRWDLQNAFVDLKVLERDDKPVWLRVGRQELTFGSQRLVSPLDWANTRRNFQGIRLNSPGVDWDLDAWLTNPVNTAIIGNGGGIGLRFGVDYLDSRFDPANSNIAFGGGYASYKGIKNHVIDTYLLWAYYDGPFPGGSGFPVGNRLTYGHRWAGTFNVECGHRAWLTDVEGGYQFGDDRGHSVQAGFVAAGIGHQWKNVMWEPTVWGFYDYATGDGNPGDDVNNTFFQYYGLVHAYMGMIDNLARQNLSDINWRLQLKPTQKLNLQVAQHFFQLANTNDRLYTVGGQPFAPETNRGSHIGTELDLLATYNVNANLSFEMGYFQFFYGDYINNVSPRGTAEQLYVQTTLRY